MEFTKEFIEGLAVDQSGICAKIAAEPSTSDYGEEYWSDRGYAAIDPEGHIWWIASRLRDAVRK